MHIIRLLINIDRLAFGENRLAGKKSLNSIMKEESNKRM
jgi:hypothetical protein